MSDMQFQAVKEERDLRTVRLPSQGGSRTVQADGVTSIELPPRPDLGTVIVEEASDPIVIPRGDGFVWKIKRSDVEKKA